MKTHSKMPLFPLNAILCPRGRIPLQVFEPRYLDMIGRCLKSGTEFVAVMLREGRSGGDDFYQVGTLARPVDFDKGAEEGFIALTIEGLSRVKLSDTIKMEDGLWVADIHASNEEDFVALPERYSELRIVLEALVKHPFVHDLNMDIDFHDGREVGWRLTELLPIDNRQKQSLFELQDPIQRLEALSDQLATMMI